MKILPAERDGKHLVIRTEPPLTHEECEVFKELIVARGYRDSIFTENEGAIVIARAWPFEFQEHLEALEATLRAAVESVLREHDHHLWPRTFQKKA